MITIRVIYAITELSQADNVEKTQLQSDTMGNM